MNEKKLASSVKTDPKLPSSPEEKSKIENEVLEESIVAKKKSADSAFEAGNIEKCIKLYTEGIQLLTDASALSAKSRATNSRLSNNAAKNSKKALNLSSSTSLGSSMNSFAESILQRYGASLYGNRAVAHYMQFEFEECIEDALKGYELNYKRFKLLHRAACASWSMGNLEKAVQLIERMPVDQRSEEKGGSVYDDYQRCVKGLKIWKEKVVKSPDTPMSDAGYKALQELFPESLVYTMMMAKSAVRREQYTRAAQMMQDTEETLRFPVFHAYLAECLFYSGCEALTGAIAAMELAIQGLPSSSSGMKREFEIRQEQFKALKLHKEEGDNAYKQKEFSIAIEFYTKCVTEAQNSKGALRTIYCNRAAAYKELSQIEKSIEDCTKALEQDHTFAKAYSRRGRCWMAIADYVAAMQDFKKASYYDSTTDQHRLEYALAASKLSASINATRKQNDAAASSANERDGGGNGKKWNAPPSSSQAHSARGVEGESAKNAGEGDPSDFYVILGVSKDTPMKEIRVKYRELSLQLHPDKCLHLPPEERQLAEQRFKVINEAYSTLSDPEKRSNYDLKKRGGGRRRQWGAASSSSFFPSTDDDDDFFAGRQTFRDPNAPKYRVRSGTKGWW